MRFSFALAAFLALLMVGSVSATVTTTTYVEYVEIWENYYGGRIYWTITSNNVMELRHLLEKNYDTNHDGKLQMTEVVDYLHAIIHLLKGQYVGTVLVRDATPLHDWYQGGHSVDESDVEGLLGSLNSSEEVKIKLRFSGDPEDNGNMNSLNLSKIPFAAAAKTGLENITLSPGDVRREHTEIGLTFSSYEKFPSAIMLRLVLGAYFHYSGPIPQNEEINKVGFVLWDSPLFLFIALLVSAKIATAIERKNYDRNVDKGSTFGRKKKISNLNLVLKIILVIVYVLAAFYMFHVPGWLFLIFCAGYVATIGIVSARLYSSELPSVKKGLLMVEDVFLLSKSGVMISHETRRLKPEVDEDVISSMLVAIQDFVRESFKDEGNVQLNRIEFGDKKIFIKRGKYLILAAVMRGNIDRFVEHRLETTLKEIETKYADILPNWKGDVEKFRGVRDMLRKIWE
ncbi:MAG: hypothetical protein GXO25_03545 [Euryarchaeota archaeon]|nr:hypothetical protein [Euryarchaeota archaeon]